MTDYLTKSYGRNEELEAIFAMFRAGKDVSMHGPRRLGKTFVLERMVEHAHSNGYKCIKVEIAGCYDPKMVFRGLCNEIVSHRSVPTRIFTYIKQRGAQAASLQGDQTGPWYQPFLNMEWETYLERLLRELHREGDWAILIDELPIFLKALHDRGPSGVMQARDFMNNFSRLRSSNPNVRWLITGSIGITPLAQAGHYMGVLTKFRNFPLDTLTADQAIDYLQDLPKQGMLGTRKEISTQEAQAVINAVGWRAPYYLEALACHLPPNSEIDAAKVQTNIDIAVRGMLTPHNSATFGTWEEHLRKHHSAQQGRLSFGILNALADEEGGLTLDTLMGGIGDATLGRDFLRHHLDLMIDEGFLIQEPRGDDAAPYRFRLIPLRLWWKRYRPQAQV